MKWERIQLVTNREGQDGVQEEVGQISGGPGKRWGHTCNAVNDGRFLYVFGGYGKDNCQTNQVHVFDTAKQTWTHPLVKGVPPTPRDSHTCTTVGDYLFVFGGTDGSNPLSDLHVLDTSSHTWLCPSTRGAGPEAREGHSGTLVDRRLFIFGGCGKASNKDDEIYYNDLYILNTETFEWSRAMTSGPPPSPRDSHTCSSWKNKVIVIGGEDGHDYYLSDVHILDTDILVWTQLNTSGQLLPPRAGHTTVAFGKYLFVFGGFTDAQNLYNDLFMLDIDSGVWTKMMATGDGPSARFSVAGDCLDPQKSGVIVFIGGCNKSLEALEDMYYLYTGLARETPRRLEKLSLRKQLKLKCQEQNLNPVHDKALVKVGIGADMYESVPVHSYGLPSQPNYPLNLSQHLRGKKTFQAKVTESILSGYTIETVIDGKPLRGILFANKPTSNFIPNHGTPPRKRSAEETGSGLLNGDSDIKSKSSRHIKEDAKEDDKMQGEGVHENESTVIAPQMEVASDAIVKDPEPSDTSITPHKVISSPNPEQSIAVPPLGVEDKQMLDVSNPSTEVPENERKNDELDPKTDVPEETRPDTDKDTLALTPNQVPEKQLHLNVSDGKTTMATEEHSEAA